MASKKVLELQTEIGISGESEYREAMNAISKNLSVVNSEMRLLTAEYAGNEKSTAALTAKQDVLKKKMAEQEQQVKATEEMLTKLKDTGQEGSDTWKTYEAKLNNSKAAMKDTENQIQSIDEELKKNKISWEQIGEAVAVAGKAIGGALIGLGTAAIGAATGLAKLTLDTSQWADDLLTTAEQTRQSAEDLQKWDYACKIIDADMDTLTKTMAKNIKSMDAAREGTGATADAYKAIGVSVTDANGQLRDSNDVYWEAIDALGKINNETERDAMSMQIFGKSAQDLNVIIGAGSEAFKEMGNRAEELGAVLSDDQLDRLGAFDDKMMDLQTATDGLKRSGSLIALPFLDMLAAEGIPILGEFSKAVNAADGDLGKMAGAGGKAISGLLNLVTSRLPEFVEMGVGMVQSLITGVVDNAPVMAGSAVKIVTTLVSALSTMLPLLIDGGLQVITALAGGIGANLPLMVRSIVALFPVILQTIIANLPMLLKGALSIVTGLADGILLAIPMLIASLPRIISGIIDFIAGAIPDIVNAAISLINGVIEALPQIIEMIVVALPQIIGKIIEFLTESVPMIMDAGFRLLGSLVGALPQIIEMIVTALPQIISGIVGGFSKAIPQIINAGITLLTALITNMPIIIQTIVTSLPQIITAIINTLADNLPLIIDAGIQLLTALITNLPEIISKIITAIPQIITAIVNAFGDNRHEIIEAGKNLITGIWDGIIAMKDWLWDKVSGFFSDVVGWAKKTLGISSPSKVFAGIGEFMAEGLGEGFADQIGEVGRKIQQSTKKIIPELDGFDFPDPKHPRGSGSGAGSGRGMTIIDRLQVIVNVPPGSDGQAVGEAAAVSLLQTLKIAGAQL